MYTTNVNNLDQILSSLQCYVNRSRVRQDVYNLLRQIPSLQPNCGTFTHNDGTSSTLLNLEGTIPIYYRSNQYNIPVEFWIVETYPMSPAVCFVRPTPDMMVKPGHAHVNSDGFVKIPYIMEWRQDYTLVELVAHMCSIFGNAPPVFRRPVQPVAQYPPNVYGSSTSTPSATGYPYGQSGTYYGAAGSYQNGVPPQPYPPYQTNTSPPQNRMVSGGQQNANNRYEDRAATLKLDVTVKVQQEMEKLFKRVRDDIDLQFEHQLQLTQSRENVEHGIQSLKFLREDLTRAVERIATHDSELDKWLEKHEGIEAVDSDTILIEGDIYSKQLVKLLSKYLAIEDALYFMDRALSDGEMDLTTFLKEVRKLAREQFMCQALIQKVVEHQQQMISSVG